MLREAIAKILILIALILVNSFFISAERAAEDGSIEKSKKISISPKKKGRFWNCSLTRCRRLKGWKGRRKKS